MKTPTTPLLFRAFHVKAGIITDQITLEDHVVVCTFFVKENIPYYQIKNQSLIQILENNQWKIGTVVE